MMDSNDYSSDTQGLVTQLWEELGESPDKWLGAIILIQRLSAIVVLSDAMNLPSDFILGTLGTFLSQVTDHPIVDKLLAQHVTESE